jgi:hypothetical protein
MKVGQVFTQLNDEEVRVRLVANFHTMTRYPRAILILARKLHHEGDKKMLEQMSKAIRRLAHLEKYFQEQLKSEHGQYLFNCLFWLSPPSLPYGMNDSYRDHVFPDLTSAPRSQQIWLEEVYTQVKRLAVIFRGKGDFKNRLTGPTGDVYEKRLSTVLRLSDKRICSMLCRRLPAEMADYVCTFI